MVTESLRSRRRRAGVTAVLCTAGLLFPAAAFACVTVGVYQDAPARDYLALARASGRGVTTLSVYVGGRERIDAATLRLARRRHLRLLVTWQPGDGSDPPRSGVLLAVARGGYDGALRALARQLRGLRPFPILRPMPEPNTPWYAWSGSVPGNSAARYVKAFRRVRAIVRSVRGGARVRLLWTPYARSVPDTSANDLARYFPGRRQVDLVGADAYNFGAVGDLDWTTPDALFADAYARIERLAARPFWIAETGSTTAGGDKAAWIHRLAALPRTLHRLAGVVWYDVREPAGDFRLRDARATSAAFRSLLKAACR